METATTIKELEREVVRSCWFVLTLILGAVMVSWGAEWFTESRLIHLGVVIAGCVIIYYSVYRLWKAYMPYYCAKQRQRTD